MRALLPALALLLAACGGSSPSHTPFLVTPPYTTQPASPHVATPSPTPAPPGSVFVVVMENHTLGQLLQGSYLGGLAKQYAVATNYHDVGSPSAPNYLGMTSGQTWGLSSDAYRPVRTQADLGDQLTSAGISWRAYMESLPSDCHTNTSLYAVKHDPFAYYNGACPSQLAPLTALDGDLAGATPRFVWVTPNLCNDDHDCGVSTGDRFLSQLVPKILATAAWKNNGVLFIVSDEGPGGNAAMIVVAPSLKTHSTSAYHDHYSLLATIENRLHLPLLAHASGAHDLGDLLP